MEISWRDFTGPLSAKVFDAHRPYDTFSMPERRLKCNLEEKRGPSPGVGELASDVSAPDTAFSTIRRPGTIAPTSRSLIQSLGVGQFPVVEVHVALRGALEFCRSGPFRRCTFRNN